MRSEFGGLQEPYIHEGTPPTGVYFRADSMRYRGNLMPVRIPDIPAPMHMTLIGRGSSTS